MYTNIYTYVYFHIDRGGLGPLLRIRNYGETQSMRRQCAIFVAEISLANGIYDNMLSYLYTYPHTYIFAYMYQCAFVFGYTCFVAIHCAKSSWNPAGVETAYCTPVDVDPGTFFCGTNPKYTLVQCSMLVVQIEQKDGTGVETPHPKSLLGWYRDILRYACFSTCRAFLWCSYLLVL